MSEPCRHSNVKALRATFADLLGGRYLIVSVRCMDCKVVGVFTDHIANVVDDRAIEWADA